MSRKIPHSRANVSSCRDLPLQGDAYDRLHHPMVRGVGQAAADAEVHAEAFAFEVGDEIEHVVLLRRVGHLVEAAEAGVVFKPERPLVVDHTRDFEVQVEVRGVDDLFGPERAKPKIGLTANSQGPLR